MFHSSKIFKGFLSYIFLFTIFFIVSKEELTLSDLHKYHLERSPFKHTHEHQTDCDLLDNTIPCNDINMIENTGGMPGDAPGPSQWGPPINLGTFGDKRGI